MLTIYIKNMKNLIKKVLSEEMGVQTDIKDLSEFMADWVIEYISIYLGKGAHKNGLRGDIRYPSKIEDDVINRTNIEKFTVNTDVEIGDDEIVDGRFTPKKTSRMDKGFYIELELNIKLKNPKDLPNLKNNINSVLNHELNHALVFVKQYDKPNNGINYTNINKKLSLEYGSNPTLFEFIKMMYLTTPEEVQARVQEAGSLLDTIKSKNYHNTLRELYRYQSITDARVMMGYKVGKVLGLDPKVISDFLESVSLNDDSHKIGKITDPTSFFNKWENNINKSGLELNKKILKLVANKFNKEDDLLKEGNYNFSNAMNYISKDDDLFKSVFGVDLNTWD